VEELAINPGGLVLVSVADRDLSLPEAMLYLSGIADIMVCLVHHAF
jgi:hypothetical protein